LGRARIVKVSDEEYELLQRVRQDLATKGSQRLPQQLRSQVDQQIKLGDLALGALIGFGALAFLALLNNALADEK